MITKIFILVNVWDIDALISGMKVFASCESADKYLADYLEKNPDEKFEDYEIFEKQVLP